jgi:hypothetical protein
MTGIVKPVFDSRHEQGFLSLPSHPNRLSVESNLISKDTAASHFFGGKATEE